jgi:hypothetical protein
MDLFSGGREPGLSSARRRRQRRKQTLTKAKSSGPFVKNRWRNIAISLIDSQGGALSATPLLQPSWLSVFPVMPLVQALRRA